MPRARRLAGLAYAFVAHFAATTAFAYLLGFLLGTRVPRTVDRGGPAAPAGVALLLDLALLALFAVPHSVLARPAVKRALGPLLDGPLGRSTYGVVASLSMALVFWQWRPVPHPVWQADGWAGLVIRALFWTGWAFCAASVLSTNLFDLTGLRQAWAWARGRQAAERPLTRALLYGRVRHPLYVGFLLALWAAPAMTAGRLLLAGACTAYILVAVRYEERDLARLHGPAYDVYRAEVPRFGVSLPRRARAGSRR